MRNFFCLLVLLLLFGCTSFNIEGRLNEFYNFPGFGLQSGPATTMSLKSKDEVIQRIGYAESEKEKVKRIWRYIKAYYSSAPITDGANVRTVNEIITSKSLRHCGEYGVLWVSLLRVYGIPCRLISGLNLQEGKDLATKSFSGHEFIEAYIDERYIIIDSTRGLYFEGEIKDRIIPIKIDSFAPKGFIVMMLYFDPRNVIKTNDDWSFHIRETKSFFISKDFVAQEYWEGKKIEDL